MWKLLPYFLKQKISRNVMISSSINIEQGTFPVCGHQELRTLKVQSNWWKLWSYVRHMPHVRTPHRKKTVPSWRRQWNPTPVPLPGKSHGQRSLGGCSPWGLEESDTTERLHFHFSLSCIGEGNGNPLQCSCLENPRDSGAWWAASYGVAHSRTRLKWLSSSSSSKNTISGTELSVFESSLCTF